MGAKLAENVSPLVGRLAPLLGRLAPCWANLIATPAPDVCDDYDFALVWGLIKVKEVKDKTAVSL